MRSLNKNFRWFLLFVGSFSLIFFAAIYLSVERSVYSLIDHHLVEDLAEFEKLYKEGEEFRKWEVFVLRNQEGLIIDTNNPELTPPFKKDRMPYVETLSFRGKTYRFITMDTPKGYYLQYGIDISESLEFLRLLKLALLVGYFLFILSFLIFYWLFMKRGLRGLERAVKRILEGQKVETYDEIKPLAEALKGKMKALKDQSDQYRDLLMALSHSLKTPLGRIYLKLDRLSRDFKGGEIEKIKQELHKIEKVAHSFLRVSKLSVQSYNLSLQRQNLKDLLQELLKLYEGKVISLYLDEVYVLCDPEITLEIFDILLDNALRHGEGKVWVSLTRNAFVVENLSQKPLGVSKRGKMGGVGLYIAKKLCSAQGWSMNLEEDQEGDLYRIKAKVVFANS
ncbi:MAG: sensor histidine kinase [Aquificaceae bacterium]